MELRDNPLNLSPAEWWQYQNIRERKGAHAYPPMRKPGGGRKRMLSEAQQIERIVSIIAANPGIRKESLVKAASGGSCLVRKIIQNGIGTHWQEKRERRDGSRKSGACYYPMHVGQ